MKWLEKQYQSKWSRKRHIKEMSKPLKVVLNQIRSLEPEINKHILKILLFEQESTWKKSVTNWLMDISRYRIKPNNDYLKKGQYFELLFNEPFDNGKESYKQSVIYKISDVLLYNDNYDKMYSKYRNELIPVEEWKGLLKEFYIEIDDYLSKGILDVQMCNYLIEEYIIEYID